MRTSVSHSRAPFETAYGDIRVIVTRKPIKNLYLRVKPPDGHVEISAPLRMRDSTIEAFFTSRIPWIDRMRSRVTLLPDPTGPQGQADLSGQASGRGQSDLPGLNGPQATSSGKWTEERRREAKKVMEAKLDVLLPKWTAIIGKSPSAISLRPMTTRWGSCTPRTGRIRLNLELAGIPDRFLEYVLVHELTHLWASGHGAAFQTRMSTYLPDWRQLRHDLNQYVIL